MTNEEVKHNNLITEGWDDMGTPVALTPKEISENAVKTFKRWNDAEIGYICRECALAFGGMPKDGHICSIHLNKCSVCFQKKSVCSPYDWQLSRLGNKIKKTTQER